MPYLTFPKRVVIKKKTLQVKNTCIFYHLQFLLVNAIIFSIYFPISSCWWHKAQVAKTTREKQLKLGVQSRDIKKRGLEQFEKSFSLSKTILYAKIHQNRAN